MELKPGLYERVLTEAFDALVRQSQAGAQRDGVDPAEGASALARYLGELLRRYFRALPEEDRLERQARIVDSILRLLASEVGSDVAPLEDRLLRPLTRLLEIHEADGRLREHEPTPRPGVPLCETDVLLGLREELRVGHEIPREVASAERVDLLCSFLKWSGYRHLRDALRAHLARGRRLRVLTTTYVGVTERRVLDDLHRAGATIRVSYEHQRTRLHAKAWLFHRGTGYTTALVGSSNVSHSALLDGLEWNVRLAAADLPDSVAKLGAAFEALWDGDEFEAYDPLRDAERFDESIERARGKVERGIVLAIELNARPYQQEMLDRIAAERETHGRHRNLVVAATGTGKTVVAALDFARLTREHPRWALLFVAHRKEILDQARATFRHALRDPSFGELLVAGQRPRAGRAVFASIQSLREGRLEGLRPDAYDVLVIDEFHHAEAATYRRLLERLEPRELLGLTATPERADGVRVQDEFFGGRIAAELRLWDALERELIAPFQYFGVADGTDLRRLSWRGGYVPAELTTLFTTNDLRLRHVLSAIERIVPDPARMRALGFCAGVEHAQWMARRFEAAGLAARALSGESPEAERTEAIAAFRRGELRALFTADLFNEGVDLPETDTLLLLRPTDSPVLFQQQLGRGLRRSPETGKDCLTVLDFIGQHHRRFRFHERLGPLCGERGRASVGRAIERGFPVMPPGCTLALDEQARELILENLRTAIGANVQRLVEELRALGPETTLARFLDESGAELAEVYAHGRSFTDLRRRAGFERRPEGAHHERLQRALTRAIHMDDPVQLAWIRDSLGAGSTTAIPAEPESRLRLEMLSALLWGYRPGRTLPLEEGWAALSSDELMREELVQLATLLLERIERPSFPLVEPRATPLRVHATYTLGEALAGLGHVSAAQPRRTESGVFHLPDLRADAFFVTLQKSDREYSPRTMYRDHAISPTLFHWESQSTTSAASETGRRYIEHRERGHSILLFARHSKTGAGRTLPYTFLGPADYVSHQGSRPIAFVWKLRMSMPPGFYRQAALLGA